MRQRTVVAGLLAVLELGGCSGADAPARTSGPTSGQASGPVESPSGPPSGSPSGPLTEERLAEALRTAPPGPPRSNAEVLEHFWEARRLEGEPPQVAPVRTVTPEEANAVSLECLAEQGFPSTVDQWGQEGVPFEVGHQDDLARAEYVCLAMYPLEEKYLAPFSLHQLRQLYDWRVTKTVPCLRAEGVDVPEPPSFETFVGEYAATGYRHWSPRSEVELPPEIVADPGYADWCPDSPPDDVLYGD